MSWNKRPLNWRKYPIRTCASMHGCRLCRRLIALSERYYDGGYARRAHVGCVERTLSAPRPRDPVGTEPTAQPTGTNTPSEEGATQ